MTDSATGCQVVFGAARIDSCGPVSPEPDRAGRPASETPADTWIRARPALEWRGLFTV
jgi:hypothetical protein